MILLLCSVVASSFGWMMPAQSEGPLSQSFRAAMQQAVPGVVLERRYVSPDGQREYLRWRHGERIVAVEYSVKESVREARAELEQIIMTMEVGADRMEGFGDQGYIVHPHSSDGSRRLYFRRGNVIVEVFAIGEEDVRRYATLFLAEVDKSMRGYRVER